MSAPLRFEKQFASAALRAIAADREQHIDPAPNQVVHRHYRVHRTARSIQHGAAGLVNVFHDLSGQFDRLLSSRRIQSTIAVAKTEDFLHAIAMMQLQEQRANDVIEPRTKTAARDNARASFRRVKKQFLAGSGPLEKQRRNRRLAVVPFDFGRNQNIVRRAMIEWRGKTTFAE